MASPGEISTRRRRVCFLFIGHYHQILHAVSIAVAMALADIVDVHIAASTDEHLDMIQSYVLALGGAPMTCHRLWPARSDKGFAADVPPKALVLLKSLRKLMGFDAIITPERTSLMLKTLGMRRQSFIHTDHGAGDRAVGYEKRIAQFDFALLAGEKQRERMAAANLIREGGYAVVGYPKFDLVDALDAAAPDLFSQTRPTVLYNPHFREGLSSWPRFGRSVLDQFAASSDFNLIFAPHTRLFEGASKQALGVIRDYGDLPNVHVDLGSPRSCDMTYTQFADVYLGDVSSQVYEFIRQPRPCVFLNAHGVDWQGDENYGHWSTGPVLTSADTICDDVGRARASHGPYAAIQSRNFNHTFDRSGRASDRAAEAILDFLERGRPLPQTRPRLLYEYGGAEATWPSTAGVTTAKP